MFIKILYWWNVCNMKWNINVEYKKVKKCNTQHNDTQLNGRMLLCCYYAECHKWALYAECHYAECRYAECHSTNWSEEALK
jgi:hypothetical protein